MMKEIKAEAGQQRRVLISSIFGPPRERTTWSAAPASVADELEKHGFTVTGVDASVRRRAYVAGGILHLISGYGRMRYSDAISRGVHLRRIRAAKIAAALRETGARHVIHTGTLDMLPEEEGLADVRHYLYCDQTWNLALRYRPDAALFSDRARDAFDAFERSAYARCDHIFTFGKYVRDDLLEHYGVPADRVTAVGSGCGDSPPFTGEKNYTNGELLFVAKHLFKEKGGALLLEAMAQLEDIKDRLHLNIVGGADGAEGMTVPSNVTIMPFVPRDLLTGLFRNASLLVQPMLNDPWGQIYLEALRARTPVMGLARNGLPEIAGKGCFGFLVNEATPDALAAAIRDAVSDPLRLAAMGQAGQSYVVANYSWAKTGEKIATILARDIAEAVDVSAVSAPADKSEPEAEPPLGQVT